MNRIDTGIFLIDKIRINIQGNSKDVSFVLKGDILWKWYY